MASNFETGFMVKEPAWHGLGHVIENAPSSAEALRLAELDWSVESVPLFVNGNEVLGYKANVRSTDNSVLGIVSNKYKIVQNAEAFAFVDELLGEGVTFETAGSLDGGKRVWILANLPKEKILDDDVVPYLVFTNGHNGGNAVQVCQTPIRVVCQNSLNMALREAKRIWTFRHMGDIASHRIEAQTTLQITKDYINGLKMKAEEFAAKKISSDKLTKILEEVFPVDEDASERVKANVWQMKDTFMYTWETTEDILNFKSTAWGVYQAASDMATHYSPLRETKNFKERRFESFLNGNALLDRFQEVLENV
jgi:phage/plasmid-like protein (TIGR03299 family)